MMAALKATMLKQQAEMAKRVAFHTKCDKAKVDVLTPHTCGSNDFWLPKHCKDHPDSYRCCSCNPPPSDLVVEKRVTVGLDYDQQTYSLCFTCAEPICVHCGSMSVHINNNDFNCMMCSRPLPYVDGGKFWEREFKGKLSSEHRKYNIKQVEAFKRSNKFPLVQTVNSGFLPVDIEGFIVAGIDRYEVSSPPSEDDIKRACELLARVDLASGRGASKSVFLSEVAKKLQRSPKEISCTCGAMIVAAGRMKLRITQDGTGGRINVSRAKW